MSLFFSAWQGDICKITYRSNFCSPLLTNTQKKVQYFMALDLNQSALKALEVQNRNLSESSVVLCKALPAPLTRLLMEKTPTVGTEGTCGCQHQTFQAKTDLVQEAVREPELRNSTPSIDSLTPQILMPSVIWVLLATHGKIQTTV